ncbi:hypothetical protein DFP72DRAFT_551957 [Ephemerocybe angulata]|uniref:Putative lipoate-protein ligase A n=1 Tax=Ephemerocybe angulata TaxID=980116 RepID=A0A8H6HKZ7_9AGAR|nr:hypothetical protein DFP72DRAFT_551957 [Tulosesus angulatus]
MAENICFEEATLRISPSLVFSLDMRSACATSLGLPFDILSLSDDPYFNLSPEDVLFRKHDVSKPLLLIYRDKPCVVIGRNQNPWKEVNFHELGRLGIPFVREEVLKALYIMTTGIQILVSTSLEARLIDTLRRKRYYAPPSL